MYSRTYSVFYIKHYSSLASNKKGEVLSLSYFGGIWIDVNVSDGDSVRNNDFFISIAFFITKIKRIYLPSR